MKLLIQIQKVLQWDLEYEDLYFKAISNLSQSSDEHIFTYLDQYEYRNYTHCVIVLQQLVY